MPTKKLSLSERHAIISLSLILGLRMIGLFMVLPVFSLYALQLPGATPTLIGIAAGIYGLFQAIFQIFLGRLSDTHGRKPIIIFGFILFMLGSFISAAANSMEWMIIGRSLQGMGAIGGTVLAAMADLTRENQRTKAMAIAGMTIGFSFSLAMFLGPLFSKWVNVSGLFYLAVACGLLAILILCRYTPNPTNTSWHRDTEPELMTFFKLILHPELAKLNIGIFLLHALFTATFIALPINLSETLHITTHQQWYIYLPALLIGAILALHGMNKAEHNKQIHIYFPLGIATLIVAELLLSTLSFSKILVLLALTLFFSGFSLLEAFLPSLISRTAPAANKGSALGVYSSAQFLGIFVGGVLGGWIFGTFGLTGVYLFCSTLASIWLILALFMQPPYYVLMQMLPVPPALHKQWPQLASQLKQIPGMVEVTFIAEESMAYLKMERRVGKNTDFIRLQEQLQSE